MARHNHCMEDNALEKIGENEKLLLHICNRAGACLNFHEAVSLDDVKQVSAVMSGSSSYSGPRSSSGEVFSNYELGSLPKTNREDACLSIIKQLLFPEVAKTVGVPAASSIAELRLKIEIAGPS